MYWKGRLQRGWSLFQRKKDLVFKVLLMGFPQLILVTQVIFLGTQVTLWGSDVNLGSVFKTEFFVVHSLLPPPRPESDMSASLCVQCVHCCSLIMYKEKFHWMKSILESIVVSQVGFSYHWFFSMSWALFIFFNASVELRHWSRTDEEHGSTFAGIHFWALPVGEGYGRFWAMLVAAHTPGRLCNCQS